MQLEFNILWVEDNVSWFNSRSRKVSEFIKNYGFLPQIEFCLNGEQIINREINANKYDLILMDYHLDDAIANTTGDEILRTIRASKIFTTAIFYSSADLDLHSKVHEKNIQSVYVFSRETFRNEDIDEINAVVKSILDRRTSLNSMRGIAMAELASFDLKIMEIIEKAQYDNKWEKIHYTISKDRQKICKEIIEKSNKSPEQKESQLIQCEKIREIVNIQEFERLLKGKKGSRFFTSSQRACFLNTLLNELNLKLSSNNDFRQRFRQEIIDKRNDLAHHIQLECYNDDRLKELRINILKHRRNLNEIEEVLCASVENAIKV